MSLQVSVTVVYENSEQKSVVVQKWLEEQSGANKQLTPRDCLPGGVGLLTDPLSSRSYSIKYMAVAREGNTPLAQKLLSKRSSALLPINDPSSAGEEMYTLLAFG